MKKVILQLVCLWCTLPIFSQNLVPNPSFEEYSQCPDGNGDLTMLNWRVTQNCSLSSPDYYNVCAGSGPDAGVPVNAAGTQWPEDGDGYVGFFQYGFEFREYITAQLISPLIANNTYEVSFYLSLPEDFTLASDNIGVIFTNEALECVPPPLYLIEVDPQVTAGYYITSITDWSLVTGTFVANGGEEHITIGNFYSDNVTSTIVANSGGGWPGRVYYYIDSVSVTNLLGVNENNVSVQLKVYPNPFNENINIELVNGNKLEKIEIYSPNGKLINTVNPSETNTILDLSELSKGIYFLIFKDSNNQTYIQRVLKE